MPKRITKETPAKKSESSDPKLYVEEAHEFLKILGKWVLLKVQVVMMIIMKSLVSGLNHLRIRKIES